MKLMDKKTLLKLIGSLPTKVDLDVKILASNDCGSYIREKVEYSSEAGDRTPAMVGSVQKLRVIIMSIKVS